MADRHLPRAIRSSRQLILVALLATVGGCGTSDPSDVAEQCDKSVRSWASTVEMIAEQQSAKRVPDVYVRQALEAANEAMDEQASTLQKKLPPTDPRRVDLERQIAQVRARVASLASHDGGRPS
jgi:hypothetical protein